ncbi:MAG: PQQ-dependent sugar dehydrogenase [Gemmatimonadetes bacterium]|uniref:PQQ-dependent sugar dehydrogenase n=1 Tax=Candidatus Kutchimonas denitrificans TaxID=3056748 RepID=A0AAE4ZD88_9BACT|nr:PQQ-dependent sugar dehydrogenase [Candidatus Kutchimonas denitrificans]
MMALAVSLLSSLILVGCPDSSTPTNGGDGEDNGDPPPDFQLAVQVVASGLASPLYLTAPPGDPRLFVVEQAGRVLIVQDGQLLSTPFLDIRDSVRSGGERGLLSIAFHPDYASNGLFFVSYTSEPDGDTRVARYSVSADPNRADLESARVILERTQPFGNHNGGLIVFGPDGKLYIGLGDGGGGGDPQGNGQNTETLLGALLRIDVDAGDPYMSPADNPFVGVPGRDEIWVYGLRNPWRFAFDPEVGDLYIADVGQNDWEEVNAVSANQAGLNFGWNIMEGRHCFQVDSCEMAGLVLPVLEYGRSQGCSVTGGYVYRGAAIPEIQGHYFYSDFCNGFLRSFRYTGSGIADERSWDVGELGSVLSFGEDAIGELYILSANGRVYRLVRVD